MHVLILGYTGFLGKAIKNYCLKKKYEISLISTKECDLKNSARPPSPNSSEYCKMFGNT